MMDELPIDTNHPAVREYLALIRYVLVKTCFVREILILKQITSPYTIVAIGEYRNLDGLHAGPRAKSW